MSDLLFSGHSAFDSIGGMQQFNRRVTAGLSDISQSVGMKSTALFLHDVAGMRALGNCTVEGFGGNQVAFAKRFLRHALQGPRLSLCGSIGISHLCLALKFLRPSCKQILFAHGVEVWGSSHYRKMRPFEALAVRGSIDRVAAVSGFTAQRMSRIYKLNLNRFTLFPNAIDIDQPSPKARSFWKEAQRPPRLLSVGRLGPHEYDKGFATVLKALPALRSHYRELKYTIVGEGPLRPQLEKIAADLGVSDMVEFTGRLSDQALTAKYSEADIFVLPSKKEGFGIVFLEAWQHGLPVICGNSDASAEVVENGRGGFSVDPDSPTEVADAVVKLLDDALLSRSFVAYGYEKTLRQYSNERFVANLKNLITQSDLPGADASAINQQNEG